MYAFVHYYVVLRAVVRCRKCPIVPHGKAGWRTGRSVVGKANSHLEWRGKASGACDHQASARGWSRSFKSHNWATTEYPGARVYPNMPDMILQSFATVLPDTGSSVQKESRNRHQDWGDAPHLYIWAQPSRVENGNTKYLRVAVKIKCKDGLDVIGLVYNPSTRARGVLEQGDCEFEASLCHKGFWARLDSTERTCWNKRNTGNRDSLTLAYDQRSVNSKQ